MHKTSSSVPHQCSGSPCSPACGTLINVKPSTHNKSKRASQTKDQSLMKYLSLLSKLLPILVTLAQLIYVFLHGPSDTHRVCKEPKIWIDDRPAQSASQISIDMGRRFNHGN